MKVEHFLKWRNQRKIMPKLLLILAFICKERVVDEITDVVLPADTGSRDQNFSNDVYAYSNNIQRYGD